MLLGIKVGPGRLSHSVGWNLGSGWWNLKSSERPAWHIRPIGWVWDADKGLQCLDFVIPRSMIEAGLPPPKMEQAVIC